MRQLAIGLAVLASACASGQSDHVLSLAFEQLGSDAANRTGSFDYRTAVNVTGVSLPYSVGSMASDPGGDLPELLALSQSYGCSKIIETRYEYEGSPSAVAGLSGAIDLAAAALAAQTAIQLRLQILESAEQRAEQLRAGQSDDAGSVETNPTVLAARRALGMSAFIAEAITAKRSELEAALAAARQNEADATAQLRTFRSTPNLMVFRWSAQETQSGGLGLGSVFGAFAEQHRERTGYVVLADVRTAALSPGADMVWAMALAQQHPEVTDRTFGDRLVTTFTLSARHVAFAEDRDWSNLLRADLNLSPAELRLLMGGDVQQLLASQSLQLEAALSTIVSAGSQGVISTPTRTLYDFRMTSAQARQFSSWLESERNEGFSVIYSTRAGIEEVSRGVDGDDHGVSDDFLRSQLVYRCIHSMLGQNSPSSPLSPDNPPQFCLPNWASYQRNPFASVLLRPEQGFEADVTPESTTFAFPTCVDLTKPYSPYGSLLTR